MARRMNTHLQAIVSRRVPKPTDATAAAVLVQQPGAMLYLAGQLPREPPKGEVCKGPIRRQMEVLCQNLRSLLGDAAFALDDLVQVRLYLTDTKHLAIVDEVWRKQFVGQLLPARTVVQVAGLADGALCALDGVAIQQAQAASAPAPEPAYYDDGMVY